jgi:excisionase family DNA binding protein
MIVEPPRPPGRWATRTEVAKYLRVSYATVGRLGATGQLTRYRVAGQLTRYDLDEVDRMVLACSIPASAASGD